ncbi:MAG: hypothetical protein DRP08_07260, partial [Candidatus Aenigmatarchaeota archaeon]
DYRCFTAEADANFGIEGANGIDKELIKLDALGSRVTELTVRSFVRKYFFRKGIDLIGSLNEWKVSR